MDLQEHEPGSQSLEFRKLTPRQKANFIRSRLEHIDDPDKLTKEKWPGLQVQLINPEILTWTGRKEKPATLPPFQGRLERVIYIKPNQNTTIPNGFLVNFTSTSHITGVDHAVFGIDSFEITKDGEIYVDCRKLEAPKAYAQVTLPNFFVDKVEATP